MKKRFFSTILGFNPYWDFQHFNECISQKIVNLSTRNKLQLNCDVIDGSIVDSLRQPILFCFVSDKPTRYKLFCEPETIHYIK